VVRSRAASFGPTPFLENRCTVARRVCGASTPGRKLSCLFDSGRGTDRLANSTWSKRTGPPRPTRHQRSSHGNERAGPQRRLHRQGEGVEQYSAFAKCRSSYCSPAQPYLGPLAHRDRPNAVIGSKKAELSGCSGRRVCTSGDPHVLFLHKSSGSGRAGCYCCSCNVSRWTCDVAIKKFVRGGFGYGSFSQGSTFVNKRRNPVGGWLNVDDFAGLRLLVLNEVIARKTWLGGDGIGDRHGDCRNYDVSKAHGYFSSLRVRTRNIQLLGFTEANLARLPMY